MAQMRVCDVPIDHLHFIWPQARKYVEAPLARLGGGRFEVGDILELLLAGQARLWVSWDPDKHEVEAALVTEITQYPRLKELNIWLVGGRNMKAWVHEARDMIEEFARADGCTIIRASGRSGWIRMVGESWHQVPGVGIEKRLDGEGIAP